MKKLSFLVMICSFFAATSVFGQQWNGASNTNGGIYRLGNVGIGYTNSVFVPQARLDINYSTSSSGQEGEAIFGPHIRLNRSSGIWDVTGGSTLDFGYGANASSISSVLSFNNSVLNYNGTQLKVATGENQLNIGAMTSPVGNSGQYFAFGANPSGSNAWQFTGNSTNNGGAIIHGDNQGNLFFITRASGGSNILNAANNVRLFINGSGDVGIGTTTIQAHEQLAVRGGMITTEGIGNGLRLDGNNSNISTAPLYETQWNGVFLGNNVDATLSTNQTGTNTPVVISGQKGIAMVTPGGNLAFCENGALLIGLGGDDITDIAEVSNSNLEFRVFVDKGLRSERVKVDVKGHWPDYVFNENYQLSALSEVEQFIQKNHHLPNIPSEKEVKANGIDVAEMDGLLLKKIEELTLYTIEQQKLLEKLQQQNTALLNRVEQLENQ